MKTISGEIGYDYLGKIEGIRMTKALYIKIFYINVG